MLLCEFFQHYWRSTFLYYRFFFNLRSLLDLLLPEKYPISLMLINWGNLLHEKTKTHLILQTLGALERLQSHLAFLTIKVFDLDLHQFSLFSYIRSKIFWSEFTFQDFFVVLESVNNLIFILISRLLSSTISDVKDWIVWFPIPYL